MTAKIYTIANHKGGCSKTTTTKAVAEILARDFNKKILCIDTDPQGNLTRWSGIETDNEYTLYELLSPTYKKEIIKNGQKIKKNVDVFDVLKKSKDYDLLPADMQLSRAGTELLGQAGAEQQLKIKIKPIINNYDYILIDTPPALNTLSINAFVVSDAIIIATDSNMFATNSIDDFLSTIKTTKSLYNSKLEIAGVLLTRFNKRFVSNQVIEEVTQKLTKELKISMFNTRVRTSVAITDATTYSMSLLDLKPEPKPMTDYKNFVKELIKTSD